jgi:hypothetical protein
MITTMGMITDTAITTIITTTAITITTGMPRTT